MYIFFFICFVYIYIYFFFCLLNIFNFWMIAFKFVESTWECGGVEIWACFPANSVFAASCGVLLLETESRLNGSLNAKVRNFKVKYTTETSRNDPKLTSFHFWRALPLHQDMSFDAHCLVQNRGQAGSCQGGCAKIGSREIWKWLKGAWNAIRDDTVDGRIPAPVDIGNTIIYRWCRISSVNSTDTSCD